MRLRSGGPASLVSKRVGSAERSRGRTGERSLALEVVVGLGALRLSQVVRDLGLDAVQGGRARRRERLERFGHDDPGGDGRREGFAVEGAEGDHLEPLDVAGRPVVQEDVAKDVRARGLGRQVGSILGRAGDESALDANAELELQFKLWTERGRNVQSQTPSRGPRTARC